MKYGPERGGDIKHSLADITLAQKHLGYKPLVNFEEGLRRTVEWYQSEARAGGSLIGAMERHDAGRCTWVSAGGCGLRDFCQATNSATS